MHGLVGSNQDWPDWRCITEGFYQMKSNVGSVKIGHDEDIGFT